MRKYVYAWINAPTQAWFTSALPLKFTLYSLMRPEVQLGKSCFFMQCWQFANPLPKYLLFREEKMNRSKLNAKKDTGNLDFTVDNFCAMNGISYKLWSLIWWPCKKDDCLTSANKKKLLYGLLRLAHPKNTFLSKKESPVSCLHRDNEMFM